MTSEARHQVEARLAAQEEELRKTHRREADRPELKRRRNQLLARLIAADQADEDRDIEEIREEEQQVISWNQRLSLGFCVLFLLGALARADDLSTIASDLTAFITKYFSWFYILASSGFLIYLIWLAASRFGDVVLGEPDEEPEFSDLSWYSMLFSAGMGVGLLFWGGAEPIRHFLQPPMGEPGTVRAAELAMAYASFHWGLHAWGIYTIAAVGVAYYGFRKEKKHLISSSIMDVSRHEGVRRVLKVFSDLVATLAIVFGVAASMGMGVLQIAAGLQHVFGIPAVGPAGYVVIVLIMTVLFLASACTGLDRGIKILSNLNMLVAVTLLLFVFLVGPKLFILKLFVDTLGQYLQMLPQLSFKVDPWTPSYQTWMGDWTLTYFTWWIAWAPFVGIFIARISKGRTIRELITGSLVVPSLFCVLWFSVFGGSALHLEKFTDHGIGAMVKRDVTVSLFELLKNYPAYTATASISILLMFTFLITSADSATYVISMMTTEGDLDPPLKTKVMWGSVLSALTLVLVLGAGMKASQAAALTFAFPFCLVLILVVISVTIRLSRQVEKTRI